MSSSPPENVDADVKFGNGLPQNPSATDIEEYAQFRIEVYLRETWSGSLLSLYFSEDFGDFSLDMFGVLRQDTRRRLRDVLRDKGVYVERRRGVITKDALFAAAQDELEWPVDEIKMQPESLEDSNNRSTAADLPIHQQSAILHDAPSSRTNQWVTTNAVMSVLKAYHHSTDKYNGAMDDNLLTKFALFSERCDQALLPERDRHLAFSAMLTGPALNFFLTFVKDNCKNIHEMMTRIRDRFVTQEAVLALTREWEGMNLMELHAKNPDKPLLTNFNIMVARLQELQLCLPRTFHSDDLLKNRLLNACSGVESCRLARQKVAPTLMGVIADLQTSISTHGSETLPTNSTALVIDRKRFQNYGTPTWRRKRGQKSAQKCLVCKRFGCWSTNHTPEERTKALQSNTRLRAFVMDTFMNGKEESDEDGHELDELEEIAINMANMVDDGEEATEKQDDIKMSNVFIANVDSTESTESKEFLLYLCDSSTTHILMHGTSPPLNSRYSSSSFYGIAIDTCCAFASTCGVQQFKAYCKFVGCKPIIQKGNGKNVKFGIGLTKTLGFSKCSFPIEHMWFSIVVHIVDADVPMLLSLADMDRLNISYDNTVDILTHKSSGVRAHVERKFGHPFILWSRTLNCFFTAMELRRLHRRFGHPSAEKLYNVINRSRSDVSPDVLKTLKEISRTCSLCQFESPRPHRFKFTIRDDKQFNHSIYIDIMYLDQKPVLHIVDEATRYQAARWLTSVDTTTIWNAIRACWVDCYLGPPDVIVTDAANALTSNAFRANAAFLQIETKTAPVEAANTMSIVERYHEPLRRAYRIIRKEAPSMNSEFALQAAVKSVNDSVGPDGLVPTLLVYGAMPRLGLPTDPPAPTTFERAKAVAKATKSLTSYFNHRQVNDALHTRNGPDVSNIHKVPLGSHVLVYRIHRDVWDGPFPLLDRQNETCTVLDTDGPKQFRTTIVKPYIYPELHSSSTEDDVDPSNNNLPPTSSAAANVNLIAVLMTSLENEQPKTFGESRMKEVDGLKERGGFEIVDEKCAEGERIFGSRFVDGWKHEGTPQQFAKSRLVVQAYGDKEHGLMTHSPTVQRSSQRILLSFAALFSMRKDWKLVSRDITQAYNQSESVVTRPIYVRPPAEFGTSPSKLLKLTKPLYGLPEAGVHWFKTYSRFHVTDLEMKQTDHDLCLLYTPGFLDETTDARAVTILQTDDTLTICNKTFLDKECSESKRFKSKPLHVANENIPFLFNGSQIKVLPGSITVDAVAQARRLAVISTSFVDNDEYIAQRARGSYIASICRPDCAFAFSQAAQYPNPTQENARFLNRAIVACTKGPVQNLSFVPLNIETMHVATFIDASFASNHDYTSQLGFVICLMDDKGKANIIHYASVKCKRVARSVLAAELYAFVLGFDHGFTIRSALQKIIARQVLLKMYTDSKCLFDALTSLNTTTEKRLLIDLSMLRQAYENRDMSEIMWIPGDQNPADALTKLRPCNALEKLMRSNCLDLTPGLWIERPLQVSSQCDAVSKLRK